MALILKELITIKSYTTVRFNNKDYFMFTVAGRQVQIDGFAKRVTPTISRIANNVFITSETPHFDENSVVIDNIPFEVPFVIIGVSKGAREAV